MAVDKEVKRRQLAGNFNQQKMFAQVKVDGAQIPASSANKKFVIRRSDVSGKYELEVNKAPPPSDSTQQLSSWNEQPASGEQYVLTILLIVKLLYCKLWPACLWRGNGFVLRLFSKHYINAIDVCWCFVYIVVVSYWDTIYGKYNVVILSEMQSINNIVLGDWSGR